MSVVLSTTTCAPARAARVSVAKHECHAVLAGACVFQRAERHANRRAGPTPSADAQCATAGPQQPVRWVPDTGYPMLGTRRMPRSGARPKAPKRNTSLVCCFTCDARATCASQMSRNKQHVLMGACEVSTTPVELNGDRADTHRDMECVYDMTS